jgi:hypothetical protein
MAIFVVEGFKGCPWCGEIPQVESWHGGGPEKVMVSCVADFCLVAPHVAAETLALGRTTWNERHIDDDAPEEVTG